MKMQYILVINLIIINFKFIKALMFKIVQRKEVAENIVSKRGLQNKQTSPTLLKNEKPVKKSELESATTSGSLQNSSIKVMDTSIRFIDDSFEITDSLKEFINEENKKFTVIGAVGSQGVGKSTILSLLAGNDIFDMYRQYIFRPCARETIEACRYQTSKISIYICKQRRIFFLDCQPLNCLPLLEDSSHSYRSKTGPMESLELESQQLLLFLVNICDTILFCIDWFIDISVVRRLMRIELFTTYLQKNSVNLVVVHQRAKSQDFQPLLIEERMKIIEGIFKNSFFKVDTGLSMVKLNIPGYQNIKDNINYIVLGEMKPRTRIEVSSQDMHQKIIYGTDYGIIISALHANIFNLPTLRTEISEGKWFAQLCEYWKKIRNELPLLTDDGLSIQTQIKQQGIGRFCQTSKQANFGLLSTKNQCKLQTICRREFIGQKAAKENESQPRKEWRNKNLNASRNKNMNAPTHKK